MLIYSKNEMKLLCLLVVIFLVYENKDTCIKKFLINIIVYILLRTQRR